MRREGQEGRTPAVGDVREGGKGMSEVAEVGESDARLTLGADGWTMIVITFAICKFAP